VYKNPKLCFQAFRYYYCIYFSYFFWQFRPDAILLGCLFQKQRASKCHATPRYTTPLQPLLSEASNSWAVVVAALLG